ncbi:glycoside hydrolase family 15 protein [Nakamurella endophytica]|uniref:Glycoside hydrolase n=1 Tax=Nakamurella endophytica TaxID=1748367 RepID=A0A917WBN1_9ACTN|nr:glycoside hydrolase family 15 protein [Nakamurella endophytica]GGL92037.1 glycoside hydrolase [Nakamurella endophytica]
MSAASRTDGSGLRLPYPPQTLREYALLADGERGALIGPHGEVVWMCVPRWDSPAVFASLLGGRGSFAIAPVERHVWGGHYEDRSMIWRSRWVTTSGIVECREALCFPADPHRSVLLRRVVAVAGDAHVRLELDARAEFGHRPTRTVHRTDTDWQGRSGDLHLRLSGLAGTRAVRQTGAVVLDLVVPAGRQHDFVFEVSDVPLPKDVPDPDGGWRATEDAWHRAVPDLDHCLHPSGARRSAAVLRGLTSSGGGMVAAATTSLPERAEAGRNYDYRYVWIRDQCYAGQAAAAAGIDDLLDDATRFVSARLLDHGDRMRPAYTPTGGRVPDQQRIGLPGYPGGYDRVGNWVNEQFQLDAFGESLLLLAAAGRRDRLDTDGLEALRVAAGAIARRWQEPDAGIWEIDPQPWTHSRLICAAGLRAVAATAQAGSAAADWLALADTIVADTARHAVHPSGRWQRSRSDPGLDGALLLPPIRGALPADDPRTVATLDAYLAELTQDGYAYRFRHGDSPLADAEGAFLLCGFVTALALHQQQRPVAALAWYERMQAACGPPQLYAEEFDVAEHQLRGNLPQAFVHALHLESAARLATSESGG